MVELELVIALIESDDFVDVFDEHPNSDLLYKQKTSNEVSKAAKLSVLLYLTQWLSFAMLDEPFFNARIYATKTGFSIPALELSWAISSAFTPALCHITKDSWEHVLVSKAVDMFKKRGAVQLLNWSHSVGQPAHQENKSVEIDFSSVRSNVFKEDKA